MVHDETFPTGPGNPFSTLKASEASLWARNVRKSVLIVMLISCLARLVDQCLFAASASGPVIGMAVVVLAASGVVWKCEFQTQEKEVGAMVAFLNIIQVYLLAIAVFLHPDFFTPWIIASTVIFCLYEIHSILDRRLVILLLCRQFAMWYWACWLLGVCSFSRLSFSLITLGVCSTVFVSAEMRGRTLQRRKFFAAVKKEEEKMRTVLEGIRCGLAVVTSDRRVSCLNSKLLEIAQCTDSVDLRDAIANLHCFSSIETSEYLSKSIFEQAVAFVLNFASDFATFGVMKMGSSYYEWKAVKCRWEGASACIVTASDVTSWVTAQISLTQEIKSKTAVLRYVSHELRTPANAILNLVSNVMEADNILVKQRTDLSIVVTSTQFLLSVVNDLLDFTRIIADKFELVKHTFDIRKEIQETVSLIELQCVQKRISLRMNFDDLIPQLIYSDATRLKQVVLNLLGNALKFTFHGGIRLICMLTNTNTVKISVKDTGLGIPKDKIAGLCQAFGTVEGTQHINPHGCGLGLYISNLLALSLGSKPIEIKSKLGIGSEFSFEVHIFQHESPIDTIDTIAITMEDEREGETPVSSASLLGGNGLHFVRSPIILIVDDSDFNRLVLSKMLEALNLPSDEASSGLRAISKIRDRIKRGQYYRLILMDVEMPEIDGITATQEIRTMEITGELPERPKIVCCTAHRGREDIEKCISAGMDDYLEKPISRAKLRELVSVL